MPKDSIVIYDISDSMSDLQLQITVSPGDSFNVDNVLNTTEPASITVTQNQYWNGQILANPDGDGNPEGQYGFNWYIDETLQSTHTNSINISSQCIIRIEAFHKGKTTAETYVIEEKDITQQPILSLSHASLTFKESGSTTYLVSQQIIYKGNNIIDNQNVVNKTWYKGATNVGTGNDITVDKTYIGEELKFECEINGLTYSNSIVIEEISDAYYISVDITDTTSLYTAQTNSFSPSQVSITPSLLRDDTNVSDQSFDIYNENGDLLIDDFVSGVQADIDYSSIFEADERKNIKTQKTLIIKFSYNGKIYSQNVVVSITNPSYSWLKNWGNNTQIDDSSIATGKFFAGEKVGNKLSGIYVGNTSTLTGKDYQPGITQVKENEEKFSLILDNNKDVFLNIGDENQYLKYDTQSSTLSVKGVIEVEEGSNVQKIDESGIALPEGATQYFQNTIIDIINEIVPEGTTNISKLSAQGYGLTQQERNIQNLYGHINNKTTIDGGKIYADSITQAQIDQQQMFTKYFSVKSGGAIHSEGKSTYDSTTKGFWIGDDKGTYKFNIGNNDKYLKWTGNEVQIKGEITADSGSINGDLTVYGTLTQTDDETADKYITFGKNVHNNLSGLYIDDNNYILSDKTLKFGNSQNYINITSDKLSIFSSNTLLQNQQFTGQIASDGKLVFDNPYDSNNISSHIKSTKSGQFELVHENAIRLASTDVTVDSTVNEIHNDIVALPINATGDFVTFTVDQSTIANSDLTQVQFTINATSISTVGWYKNTIQQFKKTYILKNGSTADITLTYKENIYQNSEIVGRKYEVKVVNGAETIVDEFEVQETLISTTSINLTKYKTVQVNLDEETIDYIYTNEDQYVFRIQDQNGGTLFGIKSDGQIDQMKLDIDATDASPSGVQYIGITGGKYVLKALSSDDSTQIVTPQTGLLPYKSQDSSYAGDTNLGGIDQPFSNLYVINQTVTGNINVNDKISLNSDGSQNFSESITQPNFSGQFLGNATTQSSLETERTITIEGDINGSQSFDGSQDITITADVKYNVITETLSQQVVQNTNHDITEANFESGEITVIRDGLHQIEGIDFSIIDANTIQFTYNIPVGSVIEYRYIG